MRGLVLAVLIAGCADNPPGINPVDAAACDEVDAPVDLQTNLLIDGISRAQAAADADGGVMLTWTAATSQNGFALSQDDGRTFASQGAVPESNASQSSVASDGSFFYMATLTKTGVYSNRISASGTVGPTIRVSRQTSQINAFADPSIAVHNDGTIGIAYTDVTAGFTLARSMDQGASFANIHLEDDHNQRGRFCIDRTAGVDAPWYIAYEAGGSLNLIRSKDRGATWPDLVFYEPQGASPDPPDCAVRGQNIWIAAVGGGNPGDEIVIFASTDGGASFGPPVRAARDDAYRNPALALTDAGTVELVYYVGGPDGHVRVVLAGSPDGQSFRCSTLSDLGQIGLASFLTLRPLGLSANPGHLHVAFDLLYAPGGLSYWRLVAP